MSRCRTVWSSTWYLEIHCSRKQEIRCFGGVLERHLKALRVDFIFLGTTCMKDELAGKERHGEIYLPAMAKNLSENCLVGTINTKDLAHFLQEVGNQKRNMHAEGSSVPTGEVFTNTLLMFVSTSISRENCWRYWLEHRIDCRLLRQQESIWFQISNASR